MAVDYTETVADEDDKEGVILNALAKGQPYAFVVAAEIEPLALRVASDDGVPTIRALLGQTLRALPGGASEITDGFHTFGELYDHRRALTAALAACLPSWRSKAHHPDSDPMFDGYFIVGIDLPRIGTITYHYKLKHWDDFVCVDEVAHAPAWDGASPADSVTRMLEFAALGRD